MDTITLEKIEFDAVRRLLAGYCRCSLGRSLALHITPSVKPHIVRRWLKQTTQMVEVVRDVGLPPYGGITDITPALDRATPGKGASADEFGLIASTLRGAMGVRGFVRGLDERFDEIHRFAGDLGDFQPLIEAISRIIAEDGTVRDDASPRLAQLRGEIRETTRRIHDVIHGYLRDPEVRRLLQNVNVTLHGDRYVLPVRVENRGRLKGVVHRASNTGATVFVEPNASVEMNNHLVDLHDHERQEVERLLTELAVKITARKAEIETALKALAQLDLLTAKAQYAYQNEMTAPTVEPGGPIEIVAAKHPLLQAAETEQRRNGTEPEHAVVPIDVRLGKDFDILVITGSNTGGKTVTLKTVALLAVMAQAGMHIPARRGATLRLLKDILIDIGDEQSLQQSLSTFGGHIRRLKLILGRAKRLGPDALVLLDELGAGTDPDEGGAIGQAVLDELRRFGCPGMITTHISVLKAYAMNHDRVDNASVEFDTQTLRPTYHLRIGEPGESHAITVADKLGLPGRIVQAARKHLGRRGSTLRQALRATGEARRDAEEARSEALAAQFDAQNQVNAYERKLADVEKLREQFATWLVRLGEMKPGEDIQVPSLNKTGRLVRLELHRQVAVVDVDHLQMEIPLRQLMPDLGSAEIRRELTGLREQTAEQARQADKNLAETERLREEARRLEKLHRSQARRFDAWLGAISRMKVGQEVPIAHKPGRGVLKSVDLPGLRATVEANGKTMELSLQELFPQTGPFAPKEHKPSKKHRGKAHKKPPADRPIQHGRAGGKKAEKNRRAVLDTPPGEKLYVIPLSKAATLVRLEPEKDRAIVQSGPFEVQVPIADLEPLGHGPVEK